MSTTFAKQLSRSLGARVCAIRGHAYFYPLGEIKSWCAYSCIRCGELDQPLESLPFAPDEDWDDFGDDERDAQIADDRLYQSRWIPAVPWPRWL